MGREDTGSRTIKGNVFSEHEGRDIVIVDDTPDNLRLLIGILEEQGYRVRPATSGARALATVQKEPPALILLDIMMPEINGYEVCRRLKSDDATKDVPVIFLSALNEVFDKVEAFKAGGVDYIAKPFQAEEVLVRVSTHLKLQAQQRALALQNEELKLMNTIISDQAEELRLLATKDFLTGLSNRRDFMEKASLEEKRFQRTDRPFALIMLDIDRFKDVNDAHGHEFGDKVLVTISRSLKYGLRANDVVARWGGEEFICLLPETDIDTAEQVAEKIRTIIASRYYDYNDTRVTVTATLGFCVYDGSCSIEDCIMKCDAALYAGKAGGRNQVRRADETLTVGQQHETHQRTS